jgi:putative ABC transport system substrate-binding protein
MKSLWRAWRSSATQTPGATVAVQRATGTIPIVFGIVADPVASGLVAVLNRPGGNITGFAELEASFVGKWLELLSEIVPGLKRAAFMFNPDTASVSAYLPSFEAAALSLKVEPIIAPVHSDGEIETANVALGREPGGGVVVMPDVFMTAHRVPIILAAARNNLPAVSWVSAFPRRRFALLRSRLGRHLASRRLVCRSDSSRREAGRSPGAASDKFEMVVNRKTATALGLAIPPSILLRADEVIE